MSKSPNINLKRVSTPELWDMLRAGIAHTAESIRQLALIWHELKERGEDLSGVHTVFTDHFPAIVNGTLMPEAVLLLAGSQTVLWNVAKLVPEVQQSLFRSPNPTVTVRQHDGTVKQRPLISLRVSEVTQVFGDGVIRTPTQQKRYMAPEPKPYTPRVRVETEDTETETVEVATPEETLFELLGLTDAQIDDLQAAADGAGRTVAEHIVQALIERGVIGGRPAQRRGRAGDARAAIR